MPHRLALAVALLSVVLAAPLRRWVELPPPPRPCPPAGRGVPPRHWLGCPADPGPPRGLADDERLVLGLPLDANRAEERVLAYVPGLSRRLAAELVLDRRDRGPFHAVEDVLRVRGVGPKRLARAAPYLAVGP